MKIEILTWILYESHGKFENSQEGVFGFKSGLSFMWIPDLLPLLMPSPRFLFLFENYSSRFSPTASLYSTGNRLRKFSNILKLNFEFEPVLTPIHELNELSFWVYPNEVLAVNFMLQLYNILDETSSRWIQESLL